MCCGQSRKHLFIVFLSMLILASIALLLVSPQQPISIFGHRSGSNSNLSRRVIWVLWDKAPIPAIIRLSLATMICHNERDSMHVQLVNEPQISQFIDHIHPAFEHLIPAHKADYFRARILDTHGGMYMDADTIVLGSVNHLFDKLKEYHLVNIDWMPDNDPLSITIMGPSRPHSAFTRRWVASLHKLLDSKLPALGRHSNNSNAKYPIQWAEMLRSIAVPTIKKLLNETKFRYFRFSGHTTFGQLTNTGNAVPFSNFSNKTFSFTETEVLMFHQSGVGESTRKMPVHDLLHGHFLFSSLVRYSMNECRKKRSHLKRNKRITVDDNTARDDGLIKWIEAFMIENNLLIKSR